MEQGRFSLTPRIQRRSQELLLDAAKIGIISESSKSLSYFLSFRFNFRFLSHIPLALSVSQGPLQLRWLATERTQEQSALHRRSGHRGDRRGSRSAAPMRRCLQRGSPISHGGDVPSELSAVEGCALDGIQHRCAVSVAVVKRSLAGIEIG